MNRKVDIERLGGGGFVVRLGLGGSQYEDGDGRVKTHHAVTTLEEAVELVRSYLIGPARADLDAGSPSEAVPVTTAYLRDRGVKGETTRPPEVEVP